MRVNVYSQELTDDFKLTYKEGKNGENYAALMLMLHSSAMLHQPPGHTGDDDDRSAVTLWLPKSQERRESFATALEAMAKAVRDAEPETTDYESEIDKAIEREARRLAKESYEKDQLVGVTCSAASVGFYVDKRWHDFKSQAAENVSTSVGTLLEGKPVTPPAWVDSKALEIAIKLSNIYPIADHTLLAVAHLAAIEGLMFSLDEKNLPPIPPEDSDRESVIQKARIDLILLMLHGLHHSPQESYSFELVNTMYTNVIYLSLKGTHQERLAQMKALDIPGKSK
jgi:hypothetical protein